LPEPKQDILSPLGVVEILNNCDRLGDPLIMRSLIERLRLTNDKEYTELEYIEWKNQQKRAQYNENEMKKTASLRHSLSLRKVDKPNVFIKDIKWEKPHSYFRMDLGLNRAENKCFSNIGIRPLFHDQTDNQHFFSGIYSMELLSLNLTFDNEKVNIQKFDILHMRSTPIFDKLFRSISYDLYAGFEDQKSKFSGGIGISFYLMPVYNIALEALFVGSFNDGVNYNGFETNVLNHSNNKLRYGVKYQHLYKGFSTNYKSSLLTWMSYDLNNTYSLYLENEYKRKNSVQTSLKLRFYF